MTLPAPAERACEAFLAAADFMAPDLVEGLYLRGGLAWGEFFPGSDVDFTALLSRTPDGNDVAALAAAHASVREHAPGVTFDGHHLTRAQLAGRPGDIGPVPVAYAGDFLAAGTLDVNPVTWHELAHHGITVAGPRADGLGIPADDAELRAFTAANLRTYWASWAARLAAENDIGSDDDLAPWVVLGVSRLVHVLVTGSPTGKSAAGRWALTDFGAPHARIVAEALRARETPEAAGDYAGEEAVRRTDVIGYLEAAFARADEVAPTEPTPEP